MAVLKAHLPHGSCSTSSSGAAHAGAGSGGGRSSAISRRIAANSVLGCPSSDDLRQRLGLTAQVLPAAELGDALLAAQALQHDTDLLFSRKMPARRTPDVFDNLLCRRFLRLGFLSISLLMATMIQKSSVPENPRSVSQALTADTMET